MGRKESETENLLRDYWFECCAKSICFVDVLSYSIGIKEYLSYFCLVLFCAHFVANEAQLKLMKWHGAPRLNGNIWIKLIQLTPAIRLDSNGTSNIPKITVIATPPLCQSHVNVVVMAIAKDLREMGKRFVEAILI